MNCDQPKFKCVEKGQPTQELFAALRDPKLFSISMVVSALIGIISNVERTKDVSMTIAQESPSEMPYTKSVLS